VSDTVAVALIAVAGTLVSGALSYFAARRNTSVQLAGVEVELQKLAESRDEKAREERLGVYGAFLGGIEAIENHTSGAADEEMKIKTFHAHVSNLETAYNRLLLLGSEEVAELGQPVMEAVAKFARACAETPKGASIQEAYRLGKEATHNSWYPARSAIREAMRRDLARTAR